MITNSEREILIKNKKLNNTLLARKLLANEVAPGVTYEIEIKKGCTIDVSLTTEIATEKSIRMTRQELQIQEAIYTLYVYGIYEFTVEQVASTICMNFEKRHTRKYLDSIRESIERMRGIQISIDANQQYRKYLRLRNAPTKLEGTLIDVTEMRCNGRNGKSVTTYHIHNAPPLMQYASDLRQITLISAKSYECIPGSYTQEKQLIFEELLHQMMIRVNKKNQRSGKKNRISDSSILLFGWNKNKREIDGIIGRHVQGVDIRRIERIYKMIKEYLNVLEEKEILTEFKTVEHPYNYNGVFYKEIKIIKKQKEKKAC